MENNITNVIKNYTSLEIKEIHKKLSNLQEPEYIEIFNIIRKDTDKYTINGYGVHVNMSKLSNETLYKLEQFIEFSLNNKKKLDSDKVHRNEIMKLISESVNNKVNETCNLEETIINI